MSPFRAGAIGLVVIVLLTYAGFSKHVPGTHGFRVNAVFENANSIRPGSPVRIAGVNVGKVKGIEPLGDRSQLTRVKLELEGRALPIHADARLKVRPRIFLEGNFFIDLQPGTGAARKLKDGDTIPVTQTSAPVQLDEVLTALQTDSREDLRAALEGLGTALTYQPTAADDADQDPLVRGKTAAQALNDSYRYGGAALRDTAFVNDALTGTRPNDLSRLIAGLAGIARGLDRDEGSLQGLITNLNITTAALASESGNLRASIRLLGPTLRVAHAALGSLEEALPPTRAFARELIPGVRQVPDTIDAALPWIKQVRGLVSPSELRGVARQLQPSAQNLAALIDRTLPFMPQLDLINRCVTKVILPAGDVKLEDGPLTTGAENYKEFWYSLVGLSGEGQNYDGNGMYVRFQAGGGIDTVSTGASSLSGDVLFGNAAAKPLGNRPGYPGKRPPYRSDLACYRNQIPDYNGPAADVVTGERVVAKAAPSTLAKLIGSSPAAGDSAAPAPRSPAGSGAVPARRSGPSSVLSSLLRSLNPFAGARGGGKR
jgi:virulence factor Mce-like protein